jgi:GNAT superfamily N-acetyltransferase
VPSGKPIGTIRGLKITSDGASYYRLRSLVVLKEYRHFKFGRKLVEALHKWVLEEASNSKDKASFVEIHSHAQLPVKGFYAK